MITSMLRRAQLSGGCAADDAPGQVGGLTATPSGTTTINLAWNADVTAAPNTATAYEVERSVDGLGSWSVIGTVYAPAVTFSDTSLSASTTRHYRVRATNCNSAGLESTSASATTAAPSVSPPAAPSGLTATATSSTAISLSWTDNANNEDGFKVERSTDNTNWTEIAGAVAANSTSYSATGLTASTLYYFRVRAYNAGGNSAYTSSASATTQSGSLSPSWSLDFSTGTPSGYTLTRASSATRVDSSGYIASSSTDVARLTHNSSGSRLGLLVEEQRTNIIQASGTVGTGGGWTISGVTVGTTNTAPDNTTTGQRLVETSGGNTARQIYQLRTVGDCTVSIYAKSDQRDAMTLAIWIATQNFAAATFDLTNGTVGAVAYGTNPTQTVSNATARIENAGNGWYRCIVSGTKASGNTYLFASLATSASPTLGQWGSEEYAGNASNGLFLWGGQMEAATSVSSYIPTTTASVTRSADLAHVLDSSITSWGDPGALVVHFYPPGQAGTLISTDDASTAQVGIEASTTTAARAFWSSGSTSTGTIGTGVQKAVHYWTGSTSKFCINGGTVQSGTNNLTIGNTDFVTLGAEATDSAGVPGTFSQYANCVIRKVEFYSGTLTDANLQTITT